MPGQLARGPVIELAHSTGCRGPYWHERTGKEIVERYITGQLYGDSELAKKSEVEAWRKPSITLHDCPDPTFPLNALRSVWPEGHPGVAGLIVQCAQPQKPCHVFCHPDRWDAWCALFTLADYEVLNADARFTPFQA